MREIKNRVQSLLKRIGLYERLKTSFAYDLYWRIVDDQYISARRKEVESYRNLLEGFQSGDLILDVGANDGTKANIFLRLGARVVAVEPDELNQEVLRQRFLSYRLFKKPVKIVGKAVSDRNAIETMWINAPGSWMNTLNPKWVETLKGDSTRFGTSLEFGQKKEVHTVTLDDLFKEHGLPFFVKIDVEGYEVNVLRGLRQAVPYLSFEINLPEFKPEGLQCIELLDSVDSAGEFNYAVDLCRGLSLKKWLRMKEFLPVYNERIEKCIEVFWRTDKRGNFARK
jgi:FkbM family methyltransferase